MEAMKYYCGYYSQIGEEEEVATRRLLLPPPPAAIIIDIFD